MQEKQACRSRGSRGEASVRALREPAKMPLIPISSQAEALTRNKYLAARNTESRSLWPDCALSVYLKRKTVASKQGKSTENVFGWRRLGNEKSSERESRRMQAGYRASLPVFERVSETARPK
ncbi:hypothetical protein CapIbe_008640 [Capra ibex]